MYEYICNKYLLVSEFQDLHENDIFDDFDLGYEKYILKRNLLLNKKELSLEQQLYNELEIHTRCLEEDDRKKVYELMNTHTHSENAYNLTFRIYNRRFQYSYTNDWINLCDVKIPLLDELEHTILKNRESGKYRCIISSLDTSDMDNIPKKINLFSNDWKELYDNAIKQYANAYEYSIEIINQDFDIYNDIINVRKIERLISNTPLITYGNNNQVIKIVNDNIYASDILLKNGSTLITYCDKANFHYNAKKTSLEIEEIEDKLCKSLYEILDDKFIEKFKRYFNNDKNEVVIYSWCKRG